MQAWYGGCEAGPGLADVVLGAVNPSARLPFSVPVDEADLPAFDRDATTFRYDRWHGWWHLARTGTAPGVPVRVRAVVHDVRPRRRRRRLPTAVRDRAGTVHNTGERDGADVVQVYAQLPDPDAPDRLVGFARVEVHGRRPRGLPDRVPVDRLATRDPGASRVAPQPDATVRRRPVRRRPGRRHRRHRAMTTPTAITPPPAPAPGFGHSVISKRVAP